MNIFMGDDGKWQSHVFVRRETNPELVTVIDRSPGAVEAHPDTRFWRNPYGQLRLLDDDQHPHQGNIVTGGSYTAYTRIYMGIVPPAGHEPGYCAVVGEQFDGDFEPKHRRLFVLDEGVCFPNVEPSQALIQDLMEVTQALKNIYLPGQDVDESTDILSPSELALLESTNREPTTGIGGDRRLIVNSANKQFLEELRKPQHGISCYPDEEDLQRGRAVERYPFFASYDRIAPLYEPPYAEDEEYAMKMVTTLMNRFDDDGTLMLRHHDCCEVLATGQYQTPLRALAMCCLSLQTYDWTEALEGRFDYDGYENEDEQEIESSEKRSSRARQNYIEGLFYLATDARDRSLVEKAGIKGFLKAIGQPDLMPGRDS